MRSALPTLAALAVLAACGGRHGPRAIPREAFVRANVAIRSVPDTAPDSARAAVLKKAGVTQADLERFVTAHARNADYMAQVWRDIADSVQHRYDVASRPLHGPPPQAQHTPTTIGGEAPIVETGRALPPPPSGPAQPPVVTPRPQPRGPAQPPPPIGQPPRPHPAGKFPLPGRPRIPPPVGPPPDAQHGYNVPHPDTLVRPPAPR
jgi:hypothetical protein